MLGGPLRICAFKCLIFKGINNQWIKTCFENFCKIKTKKKTPIDGNKTKKKNRTLRLTEKKSKCSTPKSKSKKSDKILNQFSDSCESSVQVKS